MSTTKKRQNISTGAPWEDIVGYSRAVRVGNIVEVSGTVAVRDGKLVGENNPYEQTVCILEIIEESLKQAGANLNDVVRTRMFVTDIGQWQLIGKAHGEFFGNIKPATSMIEVSRLISPEYLLEIEATAIIQ
ncbi:Putative translation initiation inhibitor, yjgF family [Fulvivirga imtechensis AK7]|uniref:Putative translation initiation inhibitor, yjgF family n=1 Tax=Fulvivirga imtechensis AK7 TaxID=1237149 RepID=L8JTV1_9BACT|nr:RidA family protein [Fulvivirga imtechensis]ELR70722.1 Putative translation initiation inhibitor, yjgF family [Fulvivirga imtechensis AK7]